MSLKLNEDSEEPIAEIKTWGWPLGYVTGTQTCLRIGDYFVGPRDMVSLVEYWMTNTNLHGDQDVRKDLLRRLLKSGTTIGWGDQGVRLTIPKILKERRPKSKEQQFLESLQLIQQAKDNCADAYEFEAVTETILDSIEELDDAD